MIRRFADWLGLLLVVAVIYVLVRPQSQAAQLVEAVGGMLVKVVGAATDLALGSER